MSGFVDLKLIDEIENNVIARVFVNLNTTDRKILLCYIIRLINVISICFNFDMDNKYQYVKQLKQNDYQDVKWLLVHLIPYVDSNKLSEIRSLSEIYVMKKKQININQEEPNYIYSNIEYNRFIRNQNNYEEKPFDISYLEHNFYLLIDTIRIMSHKMCVNWLDILPLTLDSYNESSLYKITKQKFKDKQLDDWNSDDYKVNYNFNINKENAIYDDIHKKAYGLYIGDIYNTVSNHLYDSILDVKWLIYDINVESSLSPSIVVLSKFFNIKLLLKILDWELLEREDKQRFIRVWDNLVNSYISNNSMIYGNFTMSHSALSKLIKGIIYVFDRKSDFIGEASEDGYVKLVNKKEKEDEYKDEEDIDISKSDIENSLRSIKYKYIYQFFCDSLQKFKNTWYASNLLNDDKTDIRPKEEKKYFYKRDAKANISITYKNIYNYAKNLIHKEYGKKYVRFPNNWVSLTDKQKQIIIDRLNSKDDKWFNISRYIKYMNLLELYGESNIAEVNKQLFKLVNTEFISIIFEVLITRGILTQFKPVSHKTDQAFTNRDEIYKLQTDIFEQSEHNEYWKSAYSYLALTPYKDMKPFMTKDGPKNYFSFAADPKTSWYLAYSYDWIAQIGFCHHFINNRVIFITGGTGVGKSTEVPKLFLYYSISIDYINAPKLVCTQPRKTPTERNADYVSSTLGVPIYENIDGKMVETDNYFIQMAHSETKHIKNQNHASLKYVTDGYLVKELSNPLLKKINTYENRYTHKNTYDIVMIDEAHEHKINMDILLTHLKYGVLHNNSVRLVILSATMDEDEPRYRRFYRDINDNRKYPLNSWIKNKQIDRINVDRRYHISPVGMTTKYIINEIYSPNSSIQDVVDNILQTSTTGDILIFQSGRKDIDNLVSELNNSTPFNVIALPYYSDLDRLNRNFIENIDKYLQNLRIDKTKNFALTPYEQLTQGYNNYTRAIIVATNIAEASITIPTLKFVIETGEQKMVRYDYERIGDVFFKTAISESSRIQRKGRVGRKSSGTVYYLYEKGIMEENKTVYEMSINNIFLELYSKLKVNDNEKELIPSEFDLNNPKNNRIKEELITSTFSESGLDRFLINQYFINIDNKLIFYDYYGNNSMYDYKNYKPPHKYYQSGYSHKTLTDNYGSFWLINIDEDYIKRNINGDITGLIDDTLKDITFIKKGRYKGKIKSKKMISFWKLLKDYLYIGASKESKQITKTQLGLLINNLTDSFDIETEHNMIRSLIFSIFMNSDNYMSKLFVIYDILKFDMSSLLETTFINDKEQTIMNNINVSVDKKDRKSDSNVLIKLLLDFDKLLSKIGLSDNITDRKYLRHLITNQDNFTSEDIIHMLNNSQPNESLKNKIIISKLDKYKQKYLEELSKISDLVISNHKEEIKIWCKDRFVNYNIMVSYLKKYMILQKKILQIKIGEYSHIINILKDKFSKWDMNNRNIDKIELSFLFGYVYNVCKKIPQSNFYLSVSKPVLTNSFRIESFSPYKFIPNSFMTIEYTQNYLLYLKSHVEFNTISCIHYINPQTITMLGHIYSRKFFETIMGDKSSVKEFIDRQNKTYNDTKFMTDINTDVSNAVANYNKTVEHIKQECINHANDIITQFIYGLDPKLIIFLR